MNDVIEYLNEVTHVGDKEEIWITGPGWYFWNESWSNAFGPFESREIALVHLQLYASKL